MVNRHFWNDPIARLTQRAILALLFVFCLATAPAYSQDTHDDDPAHDHGAEQVADTLEHHPGEDDDDHAEPATAGDEHGDDHEEEEGVLELTADAMKMAGIQLSTVGVGNIGTSIHVPGEIGFDEDRLVHVVPRFDGIVKEAGFRIGDRVEEGDILAIVESNESLSTYKIKSPLSGWIIEKHVTSGEFVSAEGPIYVIADLSQVWVNLAVFPKDAEKIGPGQTVTLHAIGSDTWTEGTIEYLTPVLDARTRSMTARIVLPNPNNTWRPGTFVHADIVASRGEERRLVEKGAVQVLDGETVVFVPVGSRRFRPVPVQVGESDPRFIEILSGLDKGMEYVANGSFELKAKIVTSALGGHAGHGH